MTRIGQLLLLISAAALWAASRMVWVEVRSFDGLGQPETTALSGGSWATALTAITYLLAAAAIAPLAVRGWQLRLLAFVVAAMSAVMGYLAIGLWVIRDVGARAAELAQVPLTELTGTQRHYGGATIALAAAIGTLVGAVLLLRSSAKPRPETERFARRGAAQPVQDAAPTSERAIWDALDEGRDPTDPDNKGR